MHLVIKLVRHREDIIHNRGIDCFTGLGSSCQEQADKNVKMFRICLKEHDINMTLLS